MKQAKSSTGGSPRRQSSFTKIGKSNKLDKSRVGLTEKSPRMPIPANTTHIQTGTDCQARSRGWLDGMARLAAGTSLVSILSIAHRFRPARRAVRARQVPATAVVTE